MEFIRIKGAKENNLKNVSLDIPKHQLIVFTGLSGSGKSSLAFNTIYAEGHRRYVESLSSYARQFLGQYDKPHVESIEGLSPTIAIDQKTASRNPRSTVGTVTEIYDYFRLLFARIGQPFCPTCHTEIKAQTVQQIVDQVMNMPEGSKLQLLAPIVKGKKGEHILVFKDLLKKGFIRARVDGTIVEIEPEMKLEKNIKHTIEVLVDRIKLKENARSRISDSVELALNSSDGTMIVLTDENETLFSKNFSCMSCGFSFDEISPRTFSFNSPFGACKACNGLGFRQEANPEVVLTDSKSINGKCFPLLSRSRFSHKALVAAAEAKGIPINVPFKRLPEEAKHFLLHGGDVYFDFMHKNLGGRTKMHSFSTFKGALEIIREKFLENEEFDNKDQTFLLVTCHTCQGARLKREMLSVKVNGKNIHEVGSLNIEDCQQFFKTLTLTENEKTIIEQVSKEINERLNFLNEVGLGYLTLTRNAATLSGGEAQRIRLATQIGSGLTGVLYVLDEPSIGLHQRDNDRLLTSLKRLRDLGNTLIVVEHDEDTMREADFIVDIGPLAGVGGGTIVAAGTFETIVEADSLTADYLSGRKTIPIPEERRLPNDFIHVLGARENNLKNIDVSFPLGVLCSVTGVSGSGKSTLVNQILYRAIANKLNHSSDIPGEHEDIQGLDKIDKIVNIDQSPIGRTPRSNPATYVGLFDEIRKLYAATNQAKMKGYQAGRFSFNVAGGRCEACKGDGMVKIEMHFLSDVYVPCEVCEGKRYERETLDIEYKGKNIHDVLEMTVEEACSFFKHIPKIYRKLETLHEVGLGYVKLGQPATTLSGGEAQRVKLASELSKRSTGKTLYLLDEPTTGLHIYDVHQLLKVLQKLVEKGNTVLVIEHNLDVIKSSDFVIDLGPEGGAGGGELIATGTPEQITRFNRSYTGHYLKKIGL